MHKRDITHYLDPKLVFFLNSITRDEVLKEMVSHIHQARKLEQEEVFYQAIINREKIVSTGIGMGIALPHAKLSSLDQFFIAIAVLTKPVEWHSLDGAPVRLVFMIGGPDDQQTEYLQILSSLTHAIKDEERRQKLLILQQPSAIIELFHTI